MRAVCQRIRMSMFTGKVRGGQACRAMQFQGQNKPCLNFYSSVCNRHPAVQPDHFCGFGIPRTSLRGVFRLHRPYVRLQSTSTDGLSMSDLSFAWLSGLGESLLCSNAVDSFVLQLMTSGYKGVSVDELRGAKAVVLNRVADAIFVCSNLGSTAE